MVNQMVPSGSSAEKLVDLAAAAAYLGVHFTTLRRWADAGKIAHIRTPGGRRRFSQTDLEQFRQSLNQAVSPLPLADVPPNHA
jgi:excisionase family DNA binding protein